MKKKIGFFKIILSFLLFFGLLYFIGRNQKALEVVNEVHVNFILLLFFTHAMNLLFLGVINNSPLKNLGHNLKSSQWIGMTAFANLFNIFLPAKGGMGLRLIYLKEKIDLKPNTFFKMNFYSTAVGMMGMGLFGALSSFALYQYDELMFSVIFPVFACFIVLGFYLSSGKSVYKFKHLGFDGLKTSLVILICFVGISFLYVARSYFATQALGLELSFEQLLEMSLLILLSSLVPILPGNLGVKEMVWGHLTARFGLSVELGIVIGMLDRISLWLLLIPVGGYYYVKEFLSVSSFFERSKKQQEQLCQLGQNAKLQGLNLQDLNLRGLKIQSLKFKSIE